MDFDYDSKDGGWEQWKIKDDGYFVTDTESGKTVMVAYSKREKEYRVWAENNRNLVKVDLGKKELWVITHFWPGGGLLVSGNVKPRKLVHRKILLAASLKGNMIFDEGDDPREIGSSQVSLRIDSKLTKQAISVHFDINEAVAMITGTLSKKGYKEYFEFGEDSDVITNPWLGLTNAGDSYSLAGYGSFSNATRTFSLVGPETVRGVDCLILRIYGYGENPVVQYRDIRLAQDTNGNIHALKVTGIDGLGNSESWLADSLKNSPVFLPANPQPGQVFPFFNGEYHEVFVLNWTVSQMSTGAGPYEGCMLYRWGNKKGNINDSWLCPGIGTVREAWDDYGQNGWERKPN